jgi:hypothetical protein
MNENGNNFESVRRLLTLKRYETPPPGYFNSFSSQILQRIRAGDTGTTWGWMEDLLGQAPWMEKLLQMFDVKPVFAGAFAGALCLLLFIGIIYTERPDITPQTALAPAAATANPASFAAVSPTSLAQPAEQVGIVSSTSPVLSLQPAGSPFGQQNPLAQPVSFSIPGN